MSFSTEKKGNLFEVHYVVVFVKSICNCHALWGFLSFRSLWNNTGRKTTSGGVG